MQFYVLSNNRVLADQTKKQTQPELGDYQLRLAVGRPSPNFLKRETSGETRR